jgi:hypothetical protein
LLVAGACGGSDRIATPPRVTALGPIYRAQPPAGESGAFVAIHFTLADLEDTPTDIEIEVKRGSSDFAPLGSPGTGEAAPGGDGTRGLTALRGGSPHRFLWKAPGDLAADETVQLRLTPSETSIPQPTPFPRIVGAPATSPAFTLAGLVQEPR